MTRDELKQALVLSRQRTGIDFAKTNIHIFEGFELRDFEPINVTLTDVADLIRWQALQFDGEFDSEELHMIATEGKRKFLVIG